MALKALILCAVSVTAAHSVAPIQQAADGRLLPAASAASVHRHRHEADSDGSSSSSLLKALSFSVINLFASTTEPVSTSVAACLHSLKNAMLAPAHRTSAQIDGWRDAAPLPQKIPKVATLHHFNIPRLANSFYNALHHQHSTRIHSRLDQTFNKLGNCMTHYYKKIRTAILHPISTQNTQQHNSWSWTLLR